MKRLKHYLTCCASAIARRIPHSLPGNRGIKEIPCYIWKCGDPSIWWITNQGVLLMLWGISLLINGRSQFITYQVGLPCAPCKKPLVWYSDFIPGGWCFWETPNSLWFSVNYNYHACRCLPKLAFPLIRSWSMSRSYTLLPAPERWKLLMCISNWFMALPLPSYLHADFHPLAYKMFGAMIELWAGD